MTTARQLEMQTRGLLPKEHAPVWGIPYYDHELDVPQNTAHRILVTETVAILATLAKEIGLTLLSDEPIWYLHPETEEQRTFYGDCVLARAPDGVSRAAEPKSLTAEAVLIAMEVVTTTDRRKEQKDTIFQRMLNEFNGVPEFAMLFPDLDDARAVSWCQLIDGRYEEHAVAPGGRVRSTSIPGLELRVLPRDQWTPGYKVEVYYQGELRPRLEGERRRAEQERRRAENEKQRAEAEKQRAEAEKQRASAQELRANTEEQRANAERLRAEKLAARLRELGLDPEA